MQSLSKEQLHVLQHSLGLDKYGQGSMYRNHFCAGGDDERICRELVDMGYMYVFRPNASPYPYYNCAVTDAGKAAVREQSPKPPKLTRSQRRYRDYLNVADAFGGSFHEYLKYKTAEARGDFA
jgi:hypothetical protein